MFVVYEVNLEWLFEVILVFKVHLVNEAYLDLVAMVNVVKLECLDLGGLWVPLECKVLLVLLVYVTQVNVNPDFRQM